MDGYAERVGGERIGGVAFDGAKGEGEDPKDVWEDVAVNSKDSVRSVRDPSKGEVPVERRSRVSRDALCTWDEEEC